MSVSTSVRRDSGGGAGCLPAHVAIIMDGNGRWAASRHLPKIAGHREGARAVRRTIEAAIQSGVAWLTLYAFSSENWRRPAGEVLDLTGLLRQYLKSEIAELKENGVRLRVIGDRSRFDSDIQRDLARPNATPRSTRGSTSPSRCPMARGPRSPRRRAGWPRRCVMAAWTWRRSTKTAWPARWRPPGSPIPT